MPLPLPVPVPPGRLVVRRLGRRLATVLAAVAATLALAGCGQVQATVTTTSALASAGIKSPLVAVETDAGVKTVTVVYRSTAGNLTELADEQDRIARIVWRSLELRIDLVRLEPEGGPPGADPSRSLDRTELTARFGPRPARLDRGTAAPGLRIGIVVLLVIALVAVLVVLGTIVWAMYFRRRRAAVPPWLSGPGYPGWERFDVPPAGPVPPAPPASYPAATPGHPGYPQARGSARAGAQPAGPAESWPAADDGPTAEAPRPRGPGGPGGAGEGAGADREPPAGGGRPA